MQELGGRASAMPAVADASSDQDIKAFSDVAQKGALAPSIPEMRSVWEFWGDTEANIVAGTQAPADAWTAMVTNIQNAIAKK